MLICAVPIVLTVIALQISNWWLIRNYHQQQLASQVTTASNFLQQYMHAEPGGKFAALCGSYH